jgi:hypothetical protein
MTFQEIKTMLAETALPATYYSWPEDDPQHPVPPLPYLVWYLPETENFAADDENYKRIETLNVELYTKTKDFETEAAVEAVFNSWNLIWDRSESFLDSETMYEVLYTMEIYIDG